MQINQQHIDEANHQRLDIHKRELDFITSQLAAKGIKAADVIEKIKGLQIAIPSWALGTGGTRFGRFPGGGEPRNLEEKLADIGLINSLNRSSNSVSLHIPWDIPSDVQALKDIASSNGLHFDAVNSNTFQDQPDAPYSYKYGSLCNIDERVRQQAIEHNLEVIQLGDKLGSKALTVWLADGSCFPGQHDFRKAYHNTFTSLQSIYKGLPADWKLLLEYKPYEPNFYSTVVQDWGASFNLVQKLGKQAYTLVDLGHHLPNTNIEQIVAILMLEGRLGGFHFNDSKYGDDDVTVGALKPYQLFLIFLELVKGMEDQHSTNPIPAWMIDASHNVKDPLEDLIQSVEAINLSYAQALIVDRNKLNDIQSHSDVTEAQELLQDAFRTDVRPLVREARLQAQGALEPLALFRSLKVRNQLIQERGAKAISTGL